MNIKLLWRIGAVSTVLIILAAVLVASIDTQQVRSTLSSLLGRALDAEVDLAGDLELHWWPHTAVSASDVRIESDTFSARALRIEASVQLLSLLRGDAELDQLVVHHPVVRLKDHSSQHGGQPMQWPSLDAFPVQGITIHELELVPANGTPMGVYRVAIRRAPSQGRLRLSVVLGGDAMTRFDGDVTSDQRGLVLRELVAQLGSMSITGNVRAQHVDGQTEIHAELRASEITLALPGEAAGNDALLPDWELPKLPASNIVASVTLHSDRLVLGDIHATNVDLSARLLAAQLTANLSATWHAGRISLALASAGDQHWRGDIGVEDVDAGAVLTSLGMKGARPGGSLSASASLRASGGRAEVLAQSVAGDATLRLRNVRFQGGPVDKLAGDLVTGVLTQVSGASGDTQLLCANARFVIDRGVLHARQSIGAQTQAVNVLGGGTISLPRNHMALAFRPWPRGGLGVGAGTLAGAFTVSGPLHDARVEIGSDAVLKGGASVGAAIATGGLSLLAQGLLEHARGDAPCAQALGRPGKPNAPTRTERAIDTVTQTAAEAGRRASSTLNKAGSLLRGLLPRGSASNNDNSTGADR